MTQGALTSLRSLLDSRRGDRFSLHERYVNPAFVRSVRRSGSAQDFVRAEGPYLEDETGQRVLDFDAGNAVFNLGRNHPRVQGLMLELLQSCPPNMVSRHISLLAGLLAEALVRHAPAGLDKVLFTTTGSESTEVALKVARRLTGRPRLLYLEGDFHGVTYGALSVTDAEFARKGFGPMLPGCERVPIDLDRLARELALGDVAGLILEPIQGMGVRAPGPEFLSGAQDLCRRHGTALIVDEVFTGLGRTGTMFACEQFGLKPDVMLLSKALSGGFVPVGAVLMRGEVHARVFTAAGGFVHGSTFEHNDFAMAAGLATMMTLTDGHLVEHGGRMGGLLLQGLRDLQGRYDMIAAVRGWGLLIGIELKAPAAINHRFSGQFLERRGLLAQMLMMQLLAEHRILATVAVRNNILRLTPPLVIQEEDVAHFLTSLEAVIRAAYRFPDGIARFLLGHLLKMARER